MLPASIKRHLLANGSNFKLVLVLEYLSHRRASTEEPYYTPSTWVSKNLVEMSLKSFFMSPNNFLLEKDLRAMKWVVSTCLLDKRIMKNHSVTLFTLCKNDCKSPKCRFTGKTFRVIIWGFWVLPGGKKPQTTSKYAPRQHKASRPG